MNNSNIVKLNHRHQISLPSEICQQLELEPGDELLLDNQDDIIVLLPKPKNIVGYLAGLHKGIWQNVDPQKYLREERSGWLKPKI